MKSRLVSKDTLSAMMTGIRVVVFDLDGTLCTKVPKVDGNPPDYAKAKSLPKRVAKCNARYDEGCRILILTNRGDTTGIDWTDVTREQLWRWGVKYHELHVNAKPYYDEWIDDKAENARELDK